ncbi:hypothetical protein [Saccharicrinis aurantiacus]|uniref:hypothetical protein n=1 Tax=Saccharicrinis aurantiacus TaxID=1849719 RepID=UPI0024916749|nr:hypothetical protein [Saccharicrinis aurantiacus]
MKMKKYLLSLIALLASTISCFAHPGHHHEESLMYLVQHNLATILIPVGVVVAIGAYFLYRKTRKAE